MLILNKRIWTEANFDDMQSHDKTIPTKSYTSFQASRQSHFVTQDLK